MTGFRRLLLTVVAVVHAVAYALLSAACVILVVNTATDPEPMSDAVEDMAQGGLIAAGCAVLMVLVGRGLVRALRGDTAWQLWLAGAVAAVVGSGYAVVAGVELSDPGFVHDASLWMFFLAFAAMGLLGGALVVLTGQRRPRPTRTVPHPAGVTRGAGP